MARRPAHLERSGALTPRDRVWGAIRSLAILPIRRSSLDKPRYENHHVGLFSACEVAYLSGQNLATTMSYIEGLVKSGHLEVAMKCRPFTSRTGIRALAELSLINDVGVEAPRVTKDGKPVTAGLANQQMWNAMRILKDFNADELRLAASTPEQGVTEENAVFYCQYLKKAGYLVVTKAAKPGTKARFRFVKARNSGPRAPLIQRDKSVMDANTGEVVWHRT